MICVQLLPRVILPAGRPLCLGDAARILGPDGVSDVHLPCPEEPGVWKVEAIHAARAVAAAYPSEPLTLLGAEVCYVHRERPRRRDPTLPLRTAAAFLVLFFGGALGLCWFHADVDMPRAQSALYEAVTGQPVPDERLITIPYAAGVALGVAVFYALPSRKATTPLEVKLTEYREDMEKTEARDIE